MGEGGTIAAIPATPINLVSTDATSASIIGLEWDIPNIDTGLPVLDYGVSYDKGLGDGSIYMLEERIVGKSYTYTQVV